MAPRQAHLAWQHSQSSANADAHARYLPRLPTLGGCFCPQCCLHVVCCMNVRNEMFPRALVETLNGTLPGRGAVDAELLEDTT